MKKKLFLTAAVITILMLAACKKDDDGQNGIKGIITMTTVKFGHFNLALAGSGTIIIDWGDGSPITHQAPEGEMEGAFINYGGYALDGQPRTIIVTGNITGMLCYDDQLTDLDVSGCKTLAYLGCPFNQLTSLDVSNNAVLEFLMCQDNQLADLDVSNNTVLKSLDCQDNQLVNIYVWNGFDVSNPPIGFLKDDTANYVVKE